MLGLARGIDAAKSLPDGLCDQVSGLGFLPGSAVNDSGDADIRRGSDEGVHGSCHYTNRPVRGTDGTTTPTSSWSVPALPASRRPTICSGMAPGSTVVDRAGGPGLETSFANGALLHASLVEPWNSPGVLWQILRWLGHEHAPMLLRRSVALQPLSIQGQVGLNVAAGVAEIALQFVR